MTKEQAIKIIRRYECNSEHYEACEIAIKALEQSSYNSIKTELKGDMISRQAVCKIIDDIRDCISVEGYWALLERLKKLPPVNPQTSGDLISRQSAIFLASDLKQDLPDDERIADMVMAHNEGVSEYQTQLSLLPSVAPQPKTGQWIRVTDKTGHLVWECDKCGWQQRFNTNFCPDCGCRMIEPQERSGEE